MKHIDLTELEVVETSVLNSGMALNGGGVCGILCKGGSICGVWCEQ